ncbi:hypothetical protein Avbf_07549 [Armadillidium vulgare]|nr:hypothetical protein Avbf_07549 [Armadillidium vulgare]
MTNDILLVSGRPPPRVYWYFGDHIIDDEMDSEEIVIPKETKPDHKLRALAVVHWKPRKSKRVSNTLSLGPFTRTDMMKSVTCEASNTNITTPVVEGVKIDMNLK